MSEKLEEAIAQHNIEKLWRLEFESNILESFKSGAIAKKEDGEYILEWGYLI